MMRDFKSVIRSEISNQLLMSNVLSNLEKGKECKAPGLSLQVCDY